MRNLPSSSVYEPDGVTLLPAATGRIQVLYNGEVIRSGGFFRDGIFALGVVDVPGMTVGAATLTAQIWDSSTGADFDSAWSAGSEDVFVPDVGSEAIAAWPFQSLTLSLRGGAVLLPQAITNFTATPTPAYAGQCISLSANASSSLPVTFKVADGPGFLAPGGVLVATNAGAISVVCTQPGNQWGPATPPLFYLPAPTTTNQISVLAAAENPRPIQFQQVTGLSIYGAPVSLTAGDADGDSFVFSVLSGPGYITNGTQVAASAAGPVVLTAQATARDGTVLTACQVTMATTQLATNRLATNPPVLTQTISFPQIPDTVFSGEGVPLAATASSGLPVYFRASVAWPNTSWITAGRLFVGLPGVVQLTATQAGNNYYLPAPPATQTLSILKIPQTLAFTAPPDAPYTAKPIALQAVSSAGLPVSFNLASGLATLSTNSLTLTGTGPVVVVASQPGDLLNAAAPPVTNSFYVAPALTLARDSGLSMTATAGQQFQLQLSSDLVHWRDETNETATGLSTPLTIPLAIPASNAAALFWRVLPR